MSVVAGLDLSLTASGVALVDSVTRFSSVTLHTSRPSPRVPSPGFTRTPTRRRDKGVIPVESRIMRLRLLTSEIIHAVVPYNPDLIVVESPSFASQGGMQSERAGLYWMVLNRVSALAPVVEVSPRGRALYATGDGSSDKASVVSASVATYRLSFDDDNKVDAYVLAAMGCRHLGQPLEDSLPDANLAAMRGVLWDTDGKAL